MTNLLTGRSDRQDARLLRPLAATKLSRIGIAGDAATHEFYLASHDLHRLRQLGEVVLDVYERAAGPADPETERRFQTFASGLDVLIIGHGTPRVTDRVLAGAPRLRLIGEIEGDRRTGRVDVRAAQAAGSSSSTPRTLHPGRSPNEPWPSACWGCASRVASMTSAPARR